jgi:ribosomal protein S18 acetylase RimI-like enzyme
MSITIRLANIDDAELMARLNQPIQQLHANNVPHIFKPACLSDALIDHYRRVLTAPDRMAYIVAVDDVPAGYMGCVLRIVAENPFVYAQRILVIDEISVNPEFQRRGCGRALMETALALAESQRVNRVTLDVWSFNDEAVEFYRNQKFEPYRYQMNLLTGL